MTPEYAKPADAKPADPTPAADVLARLARAIEDGNRRASPGLAQAALDAGASPQGILDAMSAAMDVVGDLFQRQEIYVPEMLLSAHTMKEAVAVLEPVLVGSGIRPEHRAVIGTIRGDLHDIGKNLVAMMWKGANIEVIDLGTNVEPAAFVAAVREHDAHLVGISALLTTTMHGMRDVVEALREADLAHVPVVVGGAPVTAEWAAEIGARGFAPDAGSAAAAARQALGIG